ncbi:MAG TPA: hypothetical protein VGS07_22510 [Thermoanaerobaculia bacterium]|jgi:hypothetical protein|nr:hypothetical protein [Thermoanaerobaculia bacterium]
MGNETTYSGVMGGLGRFSAALNANAADLAHLDGARLHLAKIVTDIEGFTQQQAALTASKQEASKQLQKLLVEGRRVASGMTKFLQEHYGTRSEKLAEFGLQPFRGRKPRTPKTPATPAPATAHPGASADPQP